MTPLERAREAVQAAIEAVNEHRGALPGRALILSALREAARYVQREIDR